VAQPAGAICGRENNGWFNLNDTARLTSHGVEMKMKAWRQDDLPTGPELSRKDKVLEIIATPLQIPAMAILIAAPVVLIPMGIVTGIHDSLHKHRAIAAQPGPSVPSQIQTMPIPSGPPLLPETIAAQTPSAEEPKSPTPPAPPTRQTTSEVLPLLRTAAPQQSPQNQSASAPCHANTQDETWKASEAKVQTFYLIRNYRVRANLPLATPTSEAVKDTQ
jgi:hypothetical protein